MSTQKYLRKIKDGDKFLIGNTLVIASDKVPKNEIWTLSFNETRFIKKLKKLRKDSENDY